MKVVRLQGEEEKLRLRDMQAVPFASPVVDHAGNLDQSSIVAALQSIGAIREMSCQSDHVCMAIPGFLTKTRFARLPEVGVREFAKLLKSDAQTYCDPDSYVIAGKVIGGCGNSRRDPDIANWQRDVFLFMAGKTVLDAFAAITDRVGILSANFSIDVLGLAKTLERTAGSDDSPPQCTGIIHLGALSTIIMVVKAGVPIFVRSMLNDAEKDLAENTVFEAHRSFEYFLEQSKESGLRRVVLSGGPVAAPGMGKKMGDGLGLPVIISNPLALVENTAALDPEATKDPHRFAIAMGMALIMADACYEGKLTAGFF
jgi:Tfp pilus assembly PilM family ATPase